MHDMIGSAGMLRGWVDLWTSHLLWLLAALTMSVGSLAMVELLFDLRSSRQRGQAPPFAPAPAIAQPDPLIT
jgi:hypothetical protein